MRNKIQFDYTYKIFIYYVLVFYISNSTDLYAMDIKQTISLQSSDNKTLTISKDIAMKSDTLKTLLNDVDIGNESITIKFFDYDILEKSFNVLEGKK